MEHFSFSSITSFILEPALNTSAFRISRLYCSVQFSPPVMEGLGQIALIYLPSVSCLPLFLSLPADIDECQVHNGGCQHRCVNTRGSYYCECHPGSRLHVDGRTCLGEEGIFRRPVDLWSLVLSQVARLSLDQHKHSKTHTSRGHRERSCLCLSQCCFTGWRCSWVPPPPSPERLWCVTDRSHGEMSDHRDNSKSTSGPSLRQSPGAYLSADNHAPQGRPADAGMVPDGAPGQVCLTHTWPASELF